MLLWSRALGSFATNCLIIACPETRKAAIVDPGQADPWIKRTVAEHQLQVQHVLLTHAHVDHIGGVDWVREWSGAPLAVHADDVPLAENPQLNGSAMFGPPVHLRTPDRLLRDGDTISIGELTLQVIHTPGHTPGGVCYYLPGHLLAGDTLFAGSVGRTDLAGGSMTALVESIRGKLFVLPEDTVVYPGHGPNTSIGDERAYNPFVGGQA